MNLNNMIRYYLFFLSLLFLSCQVDSELTESMSIENSADVIDSLLLTDNTKVFIHESESGERKIVVYRENNKIGENSELIGCTTCGVQSGDPYTSINKEEKGFRIFLENETYYFAIQNQKVVLKEADFLKIKHTDEGVLEVHVIKNTSDFGEILLDDLTRNLLEEVMKDAPAGFQKQFDAANTLQLPLEYTYEFITELGGFVSSNEIPGFRNDTQLSELKFTKLPSKSEVRVVLVSGVLESGQSEMWIASFNNALEVIDSQLVYSHREIEDGGILTRFQIKRDYTILLTEEEIVDGKKRILSEKSLRLTADGSFK